MKNIFYLIAVVVGLMYARIATATEPMQMTMTLKPDGKVSIAMAGTGTMTIDWGDGTKNKTHTLKAYNKKDWHTDLLTDRSKYRYSHVYSGKSDHTITIIGENITHLNCGSLGLTNLDVSNNSSLTYLYCPKNNLMNLDVTKNTALKVLHCSDNHLSSLDVSKNSMLIYLWCFRNQLTSLDMSNNTELTGLDCSSNELSATALDVLFVTLHHDSIHGGKRINILSNPGEDSCNQNIAVSMGWTGTFSIWNEEDAVFDRLPLFKGKSADEEFREYIKSKTVYPKSAIIYGIEGIVLVSFVVDAKGKVVDAEVVQSVHPLLDAEALRVVNSSPKWTPGVQRVIKVKVKYTFPVTFRLRK